MNTTKISLIKCLKSSFPLVISLAFVLPAVTAVGFDIEKEGLYLEFGQAIHETITRKAAVDSGLISRLNSNQEEAMKSLVEGVRFNDDPEGHLLSSSKDKSFWGPLFEFYSEFIGSGKEDDTTDPTKASHFGRYQYMHAMGGSSMTRGEIKNRIARFVTHCWKMATDDNSFEKFKKDYQEIIDNERKVDQDVLGSTSDFKYSRDQILIRQTVLLFPKEVLFFNATNQIQFQYRALGAILHIIQDSYAKGHVVRVGWEEGDNSGDIRYFQNYSQQDSDLHSGFDTLSGDVVNAEHFAEIPGAQTAYERTKQFMELVINDCPLTMGSKRGNPECQQSVYSFIRNTVFALADLKSDESGSTKSHTDLVKVEKPRVETNPIFAND